MLRKRNAHKNNVARRFAKIKLQSAMEYLMTYGWAILIIAVVLGALFQLGVFNANNFAPKAPPGSCQVFRPNGPGTTSFINLEGVCSGEIPQYVAQFNGNDYISANVPQIITASGGYNTVTFWMYWNGTINGMPFGFAPFALWFNSGTCFGFNAGYGDVYGINPSSLEGKWVFVAAVFYNGPYTGNSLLYINGVPQALSQCAGSAQSGFATNNLQISGRPASPSFPAGFYFSSSVANVQIYNTSLSANEIQALYLEGIGGAPIDLQHLVGWWPLNGNANDYSGNGNNGQINGGVTFVSNWWSGYTPP